ncbi:MAG: reverse transcriptase domain-containing protein [Comamonadaceae bacterium]|nr:reverse transcriptase domain-containing protein [Comamonadaceae bacterium]
MYDQICRDDVLQEAWKRVRRNQRRSGGRSRCRSATSSSTASERFLRRAGRRCCAQASTARRSVRRRYIPKADGGKRPLGIPTVRDRVVQMAAKLVLEPIFEADFVPCSYGFRPKRSATMALERLRKLGSQGANHVLDADIENYFGSIDHDKLLTLGEQRVSGPQGAQAGEAVAAGGRDGGRRGAPPGGGNAAGWGDLAAAVQHLPARAGPGVGQARHAPGRAGAVCGRLRGDVPHGAGLRASPSAASSTCWRELGLKLHPQKTRRVVLTSGREGFDFLGCHLHKRMSGRLWEQKRRASVLPAALAEPAGDEACAAAGEGADPRAAVPRGHARRDRRAQPGAARLGAVLPHWQRGHDASSASTPTSCGGSRACGSSARVATCEPDKPERWDREYFENLGLYRLRGTDPLPGQAFWQQEAA